MIWFTTDELYEVLECCSEVMISDDMSLWELLWSLDWL